MPSDRTASDQIIDAGTKVSDGDLPPNKLDLAYFREPQLCPLMVRQKARRAFELFLYLARQSLDVRGAPITPTHEQLCGAVGFEPADPHARSAISRLMRALRMRFRVIDFQPVKGRRPEVRLLPAKPGTDPINPRHYIYFNESCGASRRAIFSVLGGKAFAAEYMYLIAKYESALARTKHERAYWFYPLEKIATAYHISSRFAGMGLRGLAELGAMHVTHGQFGITARANEFGAANRYYFQGLSAVYRRREEFDELRENYGANFELALSLAAELANGATVKNVLGLCGLLQKYGEHEVKTAIAKLQRLPRQSLKRRLAYVKALCDNRMAPG